MAGSLKDVAKQQMLDAKRRAKEEARKAAEKLRAEEKKRNDEIKAWKNHEKAKRNFAKKFQADVLRPHYRSKSEYLLKDDLYVAKAEDGNIYGKNGDIYFFSYQEKNRTYIKTYVDRGTKTINDGDHYPTFKVIHWYEAKKMTLSPYGRLDSESVREYDVQSDSFSSWGSTDEYPKMKEIEDKVEKELKELKNTVKR